MPECNTPLFLPLACSPSASSFSSTTTWSAGCRRFNARATARPTMPAPTTTKSAVRGSFMGPRRARRARTPPESKGALQSVDRDGDAEQGRPEPDVVVRVTRHTRHDEAVARAQIHRVERAALGEREAQLVPLQDARAGPLDAHLVELRILGRAPGGRERIDRKSVV